jgi:hypothetical protein
VDRRARRFTRTGRLRRGRRLSEQSIRNPKEINIMWKRTPAAVAALGLALLGFAPAASAGAEKVLYAFGNAEGAGAGAGLVSDALGNLYGATSFTGDGFGLIYRLTPTGKAKWTYSVIYTFTGGPDGAFPESSLTFDSAGNLYGATVGGGPLNQMSRGVVFELSPGQGGQWTFAKSYDFTGGADGYGPTAGVVIDAAGNLYGATKEGALGYGAIFKLTPSGDGWQETTIHEFTYDNGDGGYPSYNLALDRKNNLFGNVQDGGTHGLGYVFEFQSTKKGGWKETIIHNYGDGDGGGQSYAGVVLDKNGNIYTSTDTYDYVNHVSPGAIVELSKSSGWSVTTLHQFTGGTDGGMPTALLLDKQGNLYGDLQSGGANADGGIYKLTPSTNGGPTTWTESDLVDFPGGDAGCEPIGGPVLDEPISGRLYGVTALCGANFNGVVYALKK